MPYYPPSGGGSSPGSATTLQPVMPGNQPIYSSKLVSLNTVGLLATTSNIYDLYTVPSGRRTAILGLSILNDSPGTGTTGSYQVQIKTNNLYYPIAGKTNVTPGAATVFSSLDFIADPSEILSLYLSGFGSTVSVQIKMIEIDTSVNIRTARLYSLVSGNNTLFTSVNSSTAAGLPVGFSFTSLISNVFYVNALSASNVNGVYLVASGASVTNKYLLASSASTASQTKQTHGGNFNITSGQSLVFYTGTAASPQLVWWNFQEF